MCETREAATVIGSSPTAVRPQSVYDAEKQVKELTDKASELVSRVTGAVDGAVGVASSAVVSGTREAQQELAWAKDRATQIYDTGVAHWHSTEDQAFSYLKGEPEPGLGV